MGDPAGAALRRQAQRRAGLTAGARAGILLATLAGLGAAIWAFGSIGVGGVVAAAARIGWGGFALYVGYSLATFVLLGAAWLAAAPGEPVRRLALFAWARVLREAVADLLPFSQIGGIVVAVRAVAAAGVPPARLYAALVVDMTTEMAAQLVFTLFGLALMASLLLPGGQAAGLRWPILGGTAVMAAVMLLFFVSQRPVMLLAERLAARFAAGSGETMTGLADDLRTLYRRRARVALAFALNLAAWVASALGAWIVLALIGARIPVWSVLSLESLIFTLRSVAFVVPAAIGVQEASYALVAPLFGLPPETALALSLAKRAREIVIGLPVLLAWQAREARGVVGDARRR